MRIILIEPDAVLAQTYQAALSRAGWIVDWAPSAQVAIDYADEHKPDLVVLELQLVSHSGIEFLYEFRSYPEWSNVPVIVHSLVPPQSIAGYDILCKQLGVLGYYYKPNTRIVQLVSAIKQHMQVMR